MRVRFDPVPDALLPELTSAQRRSLRSTDGLTEEQCQSLFRKQTGESGICGRPTERFFVDHDHTTGAIRGLLCQSCNSILGSYGENREVLQAQANRREFCEFPPLSIISGPEGVGFRAAYEKQDGCCARCLSPTPQKQTSMFHRHKESGLPATLCLHCHRLCSWSSDIQPSIFKNAIVYLDRPPAYPGKLPKERP
jgi:Recombination endonuclease VII